MNVFIPCDWPCSMCASSEPVPAVQKRPVARRSILKQLNDSTAATTATAKPKKTVTFRARIQATSDYGFDWEECLDGRALDRQTWDDQVAAWKRKESARYPVRVGREVALCVSELPRNCTEPQTSHLSFRKAYEEYFQAINDIVACQEANIPPTIVNDRVAHGELLCSIWRLHYTYKEGRKDAVPPCMPTFSYYSERHFGRSVLDAVADEEWDELEAKKQALLVSCVPIAYFNALRRQLLKIQREFDELVANALETLLESC